MWEIIIFMFVVFPKTYSRFLRSINILNKHCFPMIQLKNVILGTLNLNECLLPLDECFGLSVNNMIKIQVCVMENRLNITTTLQLG